MIGCGGSEVVEEHGLRFLGGNFLMDFIFGVIGMCFFNFFPVVRKSVRSDEKLGILEKIFTTV